MPSKKPEKQAKPKAPGNDKSNALQKPLQPSKELAAVVGPESPAPRHGREQGLGLHQGPQPAEPGKPPRDPGR